MGIETFPAGVVPTSSLADVQARLTAIENGPSRDNLVQNGEFEVWDVGNTTPTGWSTGWSTGSVTFAKETSIVNRGAASMKITTALTGDIVRLGSPEFAVQPGDIVWFRWRGRASSTNARFDSYFLTNTPANPPDFFQTGASTQTSSIMAVGVVDTWADYTVSFAVPAGMYRARVYINVSLSTNGAVSAYADSANVGVPRSSSKDDTGWIAPTLGNSWINYSPPGTWELAAYRRLNGVVFLRGLVKNGVDAQPMFTLPTGFRPILDKITIADSNSGTVRLDVSAAGVVMTNGYGTGGGPAFVSLSNVVFIAEQ